MTTTPHRDRADRAPLSALIAAWAVPVFVLGQFALISGIPIAVMLISALRNPRLRALRWWAAALAAVYATALALWPAGPGDAPSLSKYLSPTATALFAAVGVVVAIAHHVVPRRAEPTSV